MNINLQGKRRGGSPPLTAACSCVSQTNGEADNSELILIKKQNSYLLLYSLRVRLRAR